jgi:hypothetical protein
VTLAKLEQQLDRQFDDLAQYAKAIEQQLRLRHPHLARYLDMTIKPRRLWAGGWDVLGTIYASEEQANEAQRAAVLAKLLSAESAP